MTDYHDAIPNADQRARANHALRVHHIETGFYDEHGRVAPWPDDLDDWLPAEEHPPPPPAPGEPPF
jgi:hypothetical protein